MSVLSMKKEIQRRFNIPSERAARMARWLEDAGFKNFDPSVTKYVQRKLASANTNPLRKQASMEIVGLGNCLRCNTPIKEVVSLANVNGTFRYCTQCRIVHVPTVTTSTESALQE